jgi:hypothetical protein
MEEGGLMQHTHTHTHTHVHPASQHPGHCHTLTPHAHAHTLLHCVVAGEGAHTGGARTHKAQRTHTREGGPGRPCGCLPHLPLPHARASHTAARPTRTHTHKHRRDEQGATGGRGGPGAPAQPPPRERGERGVTSETCAHSCVHTNESEYSRNRASRAQVGAGGDGGVGAGLLSYCPPGNASVVPPPSPPACPPPCSGPGPSKPVSG